MKIIIGVIFLIVCDVNVFESKEIRVIGFCLM